MCRASSLARTDAEAANLLDSSGDERDHPFVLGATTRSVPSYKLATLALMRVFHAGGHEMFSGFRLYRVTDEEYRTAFGGWLNITGLRQTAEEAAANVAGQPEPRVEEAYDLILSAMVERWEADAGLMTIGEAVAAALRTQAEDGAELTIRTEEWTSFAKTASFWSAARGRPVEAGNRLPLGRTEPRPHPGGLLPGARRPRVRDHQVALRRAVR